MTDKDPNEPDSNNAVTHYDLNLARLPLVHTRGKKNGPWELNVENGVVGGNRRLTKWELLAYSHLLSLYEGMGMPADGRFYDSQNAVLRDVVNPNKRNSKSIGGFQRRRLKASLSNLRKTMVTFDGCFEENGIRQTAMVGFSLLEEARLYEKKNDSDFFLSQFRLPQTIVANMRAGYWKPLKIAVLSHIKSDKALALYLYLDRMLAIQDEFNKDLRDLCDEIGITFNRERDYVLKMKSVCKKLIHVPLTCGYKIEFLHLAESQTRSGYKLFARRGEMRRAPRLSRAGGSPAPRIEYETDAGTNGGSAERGEELLRDWYTKQTEEVRLKIDKHAEEIAKERCPNRWWNTGPSLEGAKIEAIKRFYNHEATVLKIVTEVEKKKDLPLNGGGVFRDSQKLVPYCDSEMFEAIETLAQTLQRFAEWKCRTA